MDAPRDDDYNEPRFGSPEWEDQKRARHDQPSGKHIRAASHDETEAASLYATNGDVSDLTKILQRLRIEEERGKAVPTSGLKFDWSFNFGHIITIVAAVGSVIAGYYGIRGEIEKGIADRLELHRQIDAVRADIAIVRPKVMSDLEAQAKVNQTQDNRIDNLADSVKQARDTALDINRAISKLADAVSTMHEDLALLKDRLGRTRSEVNGPQREAHAQGPLAHPQ